MGPLPHTRAQAGTAGSDTVQRSSPTLERKVRTRRFRRPDGVTPTVTVVIPCFNYARFLPSAVHSALTQEAVVVNVVIVDDASTDNSLEVANGLAADSPNVTVLAHETNQGPVNTFNDGLELATGEFLVRLDADDMLTPGSLARSTALARAYPSVGLVYGHPVHFTDQPPAHRARVRSWTLWPGRRWLEDRCRSGLNVITSPEALMRTSVVERVGGQQPLAHTHDMEMWFRIAAFSDVGRVDGADQAWHREHSASLSSRMVDSLTDLRERRDAFETLFDGVAASIPEARRLRQVARTAIARDALRSACHLFDRGRATEESVASLVKIASETAPADALLAEWRRLRRREALGVESVRRRPWYAAAAARRRLEFEISYLRWKRNGVWESDRRTSNAPLD
jgi:hypothetical protein